MLKIVEISYALNGAEITVEYSHATFVLYEYPANVIGISTPEELQNMDPYGDYVLTRDIDMSGFDWTPIDFLGSLNGNGYEIKNLQSTGSMFIDTYFALFVNLKLIDARIIWSTAEVGHYGVYFTMLSRCGGGVYVDCVITGEFLCQLDANATDYGMISIFEFAISYLDHIFDGCHFQGTITVQMINGDVPYGVSGIAGYFDDSYLYSKNCTVDATAIIIKPDGSATVLENIPPFSNSIN